jgi:hypothetical protein
MQASDPFDPWLLLLLVVSGAGLGVAVTALLLACRSRSPTPRQLPSSAIAPPVPSEPSAVVEATPAPPPAGDGLGTALGAFFLIALLGAAFCSNKERRRGE